MKGILLSFVGLSLLAGCAAVSQKGAPDEGRVAIAVTEKGFEPATVTVAVGKPVTLVVTRRTTKTCITEFVMAEKGIKQDLPLGQAVEITFTPDKPGELRYACGMDMLAGKVVAR